MRALRRAKRESALLIALADLGGVWDLTAATEALTRFADAAVAAALRFLLRQPRARGACASIPRRSESRRARGLVVLALGKHGARELNYSSDVDLVVVFDPRAAAIPHGVEPTPLFVRMVKALVRLLQERTPDGYVFRVDLRLRPDPASTPIAVSIASAGAYYETLGQNWERAAMIKARAGGGRPRTRAAVPRRSRAVHLAQVFRLRRDRRHPRDEAPDSRGARPRAGRGRRPRPQVRPRRHPRDRVLRPDAATDLRRPPPEHARRADARHARAIARRALGQRRGGRGSDQRLPVPAPRRAPPADGRRRADAAPAVRARGAGALRQVLRLRAPRAGSRRR